MSIPEDTRARYTGMCSLGDDGPSTVLGFSFNDVLFSVVAASPDDDEGAALLPLSYEFDESLEGKILNEIDDLSYHDGPTWPKANEEATSRLQKQLADLAADACLSTMQHLAPARIPTAQTLQDHLYSPTFTLQVLTEGGKLTCRTLDNFTGVPELHPPISSDRLQAMNLDLDTTDVPVVEASQVILGCRLHCAPIWKVTVGGKEMICKASLDVSEHAMGDELATYLKIRAAGVKLNVPELKGIVQSHRGVVGILLSYISHRHHSLHALLSGVEGGTVAGSEATQSLRQKWARQIRETVTGLHELGILWRDLKTGNVLIDDNGDAVVLDFGGGNSEGWVDDDKYATMEGEEQGLRRIMEALGVQA